MGGGMRPRVALLVLLAAAAAAAAAPAAGAGGAALAPYAASRRPMASALVYDGTSRSQAELFLLDTFAGYAGRETPLLYRVQGRDWRGAAQAKADSYSRWLQDMERDGLQVNDSMLAATTQELLTAAAAAAGLPVLAGQRYVRCNLSDSASSASAAVTLAAGSDELTLIAADDIVAAMLESPAVGAKLFADLRGRNVTEVLDGLFSDPGLEGRLSKRVYVFTDPTQQPVDMAVMARAPMMVWGSDMQAQGRVLRRDWLGKDGMGVAFGWMSSGSENDYVSPLNALGVLVHASNFCNNFVALANWQPAGFGALPAVAEDEGLDPAEPPTQRHTVSFVMSDGDNVQWMLNTFLTNEAWFGAANRGEVPIGWTVSPAMATLAPAFVKDILSKLTAKDELVAGPSGAGYTYPQKWPAELRDDYAELTAGMAEQLGIRAWNILGQNDDDPKPEELAPLLRARGGQANDGLLYYGYGDGYASMHGKAWLLEGKPVVGGRYSLWGNGTEGDMLGVDGMIKKLKAMPKDGRLATGYSLVPVNAWSHSYADVVEVAKALEAEGGFDVVLPSELLRRVKGILTAGEADGAEYDDIGASSGAYDASAASAADASAGGQLFA